MPNLKPYYDAALAADANVQRVMAQIDQAFNLGTPEGQAQALSLRSALDAAKAQAKSANELYVSMRDASLVSDNGVSNFTAPADPAQDGSQKQMSRSAFELLDPQARIVFLRAGGEVLDEVRNV